MKHSMWDEHYDQIYIIHKTVGVKSARDEHFTTQKPTDAGRSRQHNKCKLSELHLHFTHSYNIDFF